MSAWIVVPSLLALRDEFDAVSPRRDKGADGTIGDSAHTSSSDHTPDEDSDVLRGRDADKINEVHALDIDSSGPWPDSGWLDRKIKELIAEERRRWLDPGDMCRLRYIIWNKRIYSQGNDFVGEAYGGDDPHTDHAHFSARYETRAENDTRPWGVLEDDMLTAKEVAAEVWAHLLKNAYTGTMQPAGDLLRFAPSRYPHDVTQQQLAAVAGQVSSLAARVGASDFDEAAIVQGILAGLDDAVAQRFLDQLAERFNLRLVPAQSSDLS